MPRTIILLTSAQEAPYLADHLRDLNPRLVVTHVEARGELDQAVARLAPATRLVAFHSGVVVPPEHLRAVEAAGGPAYNFHPGSPDYPGIYPESFAAYEGARRFGATAHVMAPLVDSGPIVGVELFDVRPGIGHLELGGLAYKAMVSLFAALAPHLATRDEPLPVLDLRWGGRRSTKKQFEAMCRVPLDIDAAEFARRHRSFSQGPQNLLTVELHGKVFRIEKEDRPEAG